MSIWPTQIQFSRTDAPGPWSSRIYATCTQTLPLENTDGQPWEATLEVPNWGPARCCLVVLGWSTQANDFKVREAGALAPFIAETWWPPHTFPWGHRRTPWRMMSTHSLLPNPVASALLCLVLGENWREMCFSPVFRLAICPAQVHSQRRTGGLACFYPQRSLYFYSDWIWRRCQRPGWNTLTAHSHHKSEWFSIQSR